MDNICVSIHMSDEDMCINDLYDSENKTHALNIGYNVELYFDNRLEILSFAEDVIKLANKLEEEEEQ